MNNNMNIMGNYSPEWIDTWASRSLIKSKDDAEYLLNSMLKKDGDEVCFEDNTISMINGGTTCIKKKGSKYTEFSFGQNWRDQVSEERTKKKMIDKIFKNRKNINKYIKEATEAYIF
jgi:hypothetical protein